MHEAYRDFYLARIQAAIGAAKASTGISHRGMKGEIREILVKDLLRPLLPSDLGVGTGQIISALGETSSQQDIVLYDRRILPPLIFEERMGLFPIESVLFAIEIKSTLTAAELDKSNKAAEALLKFQLQSGRFDTADQPMAHPLRRPVYAVFAFDSDLVPSGKTELERYRELCGSDVTLTRVDGPPVRLVCVVGRGCWTWMRQDWGSWQSTYPLQEVVRFIAIVMNTYREVARDRGEPRLGTYIL
jgi:hypothetical protein